MRLDKLSRGLCRLEGWEHKLLNRPTKDLALLSLLLWIWKHIRRDTIVTGSRRNECEVSDNEGEVDLEQARNAHDDES
jgi:hypothetical protein